VAVDQAYSVDEDSTLAVDAPGVLAGSSDADGAAPAIAELVAGVQHGSLALQPNGSFVYVPAANFNGTDSFTYAAKDAEGNTSAAATVTIIVGAFFFCTLRRPRAAVTSQLLLLLVFARF
jgi:hypothetical protein